MALSLQLGEAGFTVQSIQTKAAVDMSKGESGFAINSVHLDVAVQASGADQAAFEKAAEAAKSGCLVSRILNIPVTMSARLAA